MKYFIFLILIISSAAFATEEIGATCGGRTVAFLTTMDLTGRDPNSLEEAEAYLRSLQCPAASHKIRFDHGTAFDLVCLDSCTCPEGMHEAEHYLVGSDGIALPHQIAPQHVCVSDDPSPPDDSCPSGHPKFNGACQVCFAYNADGSCAEEQCPAGQINQGTINGHPVCHGTCPDPNQYWGSVNGIEGCYGSPTCPNGGSFGYVNHVPGCYGGNSSGSGGSGGDSGSGGSGGGGSTNNNSGGSVYPQEQPCPSGYQKDGNYCVKPLGDCPTGYHELITSTNPFYYMCVQDNPPPQSSSSAPTSSASSSPHSSAASSSHANSSSGSAGSSGSGTSSGSGDSGGNSSAGAGDCDPTSKEYLKCIAGESKPLPDHTESNSGAKTFDDVNESFQSRVKSSAVVGSFNKMKTVVTLSNPQCPHFGFELFGKDISTTIHCSLWAAMALVLSPIMIAVWTIFAFRIFASA